MKDKVTENEKIATDGINRNNSTNINPEVQKMLEEDNKTAKIKWVIVVIITIVACVFLAKTIFEKDKEKDEYDALMSLWSIEQITPEKYKSQITDFVKYKIAHIHYYLFRGSIDTSSSDATLAQLNEEMDYINNTVIYDWQNDHSSEEPIKRILTRYASEQGDMRRHAKALLDLYDDANVKLSEFRPTADSETCKAWAFTEYNTGLRCTFTVRRYLDAGQYEWEVAVDKASISEYLQTLFNR